MSRVVAVVGLGFGDEGKGTVTDALARKLEAHTVVRFNGGAQAAHNVLHDGKHHTFAQFGSGTLAGARTFLSKHMLVNPGALLNEAKHLAEIGVSDPHSLIYVDERAIITTPFHIAANRIREMHRGVGRHGSCGMGIGETAADARRGVCLRVADIRSPARLRELLAWIRAEKLAELELDEVPLTDSPYWRGLGDREMVEAAALTCERFTAAVNVVDVSWLGDALKAGATIFEGAQGVLLDERWGFHPYTTWSNTTFDNVHDVLAEAGVSVAMTRVGVTRSYLTRHGRGPFPTVDPNLRLTDSHNRFNEWQREFRVGALDYVLIDYAMRVLGGVHEVAMTHMDVESPAPCYAHRLRGDPACGIEISELALESWSQEAHQLAWQEAVGRQLERSDPVYRSSVPDNPAEYFAELTGVPVTLTSHGPASHQKQFRRSL